MPYDLLIVGGGPAGASAAIFAARAGLSAAVIDEDKGMTRRAMLWNHLGFPDGITGPELVDLGRRHAEQSGASWIDGKVSSLTVRDDLVVMEVDGSPLEAHDVLLTLGANPSLAADSGIATEDGTEPHINRTITVDAEGRTNVPHVWAAGTAAGVSVHTIVTAGDGARVAVNIISARKGVRWADHDVLPKPT
jgi:thioredoxin reductase (NADPH)